MLKSHTTFFYKILFYCLVLFLTFEAKGQDVLGKEIVITQLSGSSVELMKHIEEKASIILSYSNQVCLSNKIIFTRKKGSVKYFLDQIFSTCFVEYRVVGSKILILPVNRSNEKFTLKGFVRDSVSGEVLIASSVFEIYGSKGAITNEHGFYSLSINSGDVVIACSYVGYNTKYIKFKLTGDTLVNILLAPMPHLQEVTVVALNDMSPVRQTCTSTIDIPVSQIQNVPTFMGEVDLIKSVQMFPGVQKTGEGFNGLLVRGGGNDQNLILMDDVPVYNVDHLLGFFSIFNPDAINKVTLIKGGFPAQYGGRLSSVLDIRTYDGDQDNLKGSVSLGLLSSKLFVNGPIINNRNKFSLSYRRTYYDLLTAPFQFNSDNKAFYYFFDLNGKFLHQFKNNSTLSLSVYWGRDELLSRFNFQEISRSIVSKETENLSLNDEVGRGWGNKIGSLNYKYLLGNRVFGNLTLAYSDYRFFSKTSQNYNENDAWNTLQRQYISGIKDLNLRADFDFRPANGHRVKYGVNSTYHIFYPGIDVVKINISTKAETDTTLGGQRIAGFEHHAYFQDELNISSLLRINAGVHFSAYQQSGSKYYYSFEPRINARLLLSSSVAVKMAYATTSQYVHLVTTGNVSLPTDLWLPVTEKMRPMMANQVSTGVEWEINSGFSLSLEGYYKKINHLLDYKENQSFFDLSTNWTDKFTSGRATAYGAEILLHRKIGKLSGWVGYTLSKSRSYFKDLNNGESFRSNNDRLHDGTLFLSYVFNKKVDASLTWSYGSGKPITLSNEKYYSPVSPTSSGSSSYAGNYSYRNSYTMPTFHRLDIGVNMYKKIRQGDRIWSLGVMNAYGRQNPFFLYFVENEKNGTRKLKQFSLFPFPFPYVRYTVKF
jgi:hypothetical protein